jgi:hypothetical protein
MENNDLAPVPHNVRVEFFEFPDASYIVCRGNRIHIKRIELSEHRRDYYDAGGKLVASFKVGTGHLEINKSLLT